jgi:hypothetical protein
MTPNTELSDERIFGLAKQHFGGSGHNLIWQDDPRYAAACDMTTDARWSVSAVRAEQTLAFARAILAASPTPLREADEGSDVEHIVTRLRHQSEALRRKPTPLADLIPLLQQAADALQYGICTYWCPACYEEVKEPKHRAPSGIEADERTEFETWARQFKFDLTRCDPSYVNEPYANEATDWAWLAYQAGRAAPSGIEADGDGGKGRVVPPPEFEEVSYGLDGVMRPVKGMAISEYAFRQWAMDVGIALSPTSPPNGKTEGDAK